MGTAPPGLAVRLVFCNYSLLFSFARTRCSSNMKPGLGQGPLLRPLSLTPEALSCSLGALHSPRRGWAGQGPHPVCTAHRGRGLFTNGSF